MHMWGCDRCRLRAYIGEHASVAVHAFPSSPSPTPPAQVYSQLDGDSHVVNTAWAMLALMAAGYHSAGADAAGVLTRGARFLLCMQQPSGDWPQQHISGVFNRNCMITYANYR